MEETATLFDEEKAVLEVVKVDFLESSFVSWEELFDGFDALYAITYSTSIGFICELLKKFKKAEIIFGYDRVLSGAAQEVMAYQEETIRLFKERMPKNKTDLISRIENNSLRLFVSRKQPSHEKMYILEAEDGRKRVVAGSANMSYSAFTGKQRENILYMDGEKAFKWHLNCFEELKSNSVNNITSKILLAPEGGVEDSPLASMIKEKKFFLFDPAKEKEIDEETTFILHVKDKADKRKLFMPSPGKDGNILMTADDLKKISRRTAERDVKEKASRDEYPNLLINCEGRTASLNGKPLDLTPTKEEIARDVRLFLAYMKGYEVFYGDVPATQQKYFNFANWFFLSPFMASLRIAALTLIADESAMVAYPMFGVIYGQSNAGKTHFLGTLLKMMIGATINFSGNARKECNPKNIEGLMRAVKGAPIVIDDVSQKRFGSHVVEIIKGDNFCVAERLSGCPAVVFSANEDVKAMKPEITKRAVVCWTRIELPHVEAKNISVGSRVRKNIGDAFYREYLRRMLKEMPRIMNEIKTEGGDSKLDVFAISSKIICEIIEGHMDEKPPFFVHELNFDDYFGDKVIGSQVIEKIRRAWSVNKKMFKIDKKNGELQYQAEDKYETERIFSELPPGVRKIKSHASIVMDLEKACAFFDTNFKKHSFTDNFK
jgi:hypothetical protein